MNRLTQSLALLAALVFTGPVLTGCHAGPSQRQHIPSEVTTDAPIKGRPTLGLPIFLPDSTAAIVPFTIDRPKRWLEDADRFEDGSPSKARISTASRYYDTRRLGDIGLSQSVRWHNAIIQPKQGKGQLVLNQKGIISQFDVAGHWVEDERKYEHDEKTYTFVPKAVLFLATIEDTDGDKQLTRSDANVLFAANQDGEGLHAITPKKMQVQTTRYDAERNVILIMITADTDGDGFFTEADSAAPYIYTPGSKEVAKPMVDPLQTEQAERLLK